MNESTSGLCLNVYSNYSISTSVKRTCVKQNSGAKLAMRHLEAAAELRKKRLQLLKQIEVNLDNKQFELDRTQRKHLN